MDITKVTAVCLLLLCHCFAQKQEIKRKVTVEQKNCAKKANAVKSMSIYHFKARIAKTQDVVHYLVSTMDFPTIIIAHTEVPTTVSIDCDKILQQKGGGIQFTPPANTSGALTFSKLVEYEDSKDVVKINNVIGDVLPKFDWYFQSLGSHQDEITFFANSSLTSGILELQLKVFSNSGYDSVLPGEPFHSNSSKFTLTFDHLNVTTKKSRYAVELMYLSDGAVKQENPSFVTSRSIDDEHTPGIFKVVTLSISSVDGGVFALWKPVAYNDADRSLDVQVLVYNFPSKDGHLDKAAEHPWSIADTYFEKTAAYGMNYTIGLHGDEFYNKTKYVAWTALVGYGAPPKDKISTLVIIVISVGLGLPAFLIIFGGFGLCCRKYLVRRRMKYSRIN